MGIVPAGIPWKTCGLVRLTSDIIGSGTESVVLCCQKHVLRHAVPMKAEQHSLCQGVVEILPGARKRSTNCKSHLRDHDDQ